MAEFFLFFLKAKIITYHPSLFHSKKKKEGGRDSIIVMQTD